MWSRVPSSSEVSVECERVLRGGAAGGEQRHAGHRLRETGRERGEPKLEAGKPPIVEACACIGGL